MTYLEVLAAVLGGIGTVVSVISLFLWMSKRIGDLRTELSGALKSVAQKLDDHLEFNRERFAAIEREKDKILKEAEREHERVKESVLKLEEDVRACQTRCGKRSEDYTRATVTVGHLVEQIAALKAQFTGDISALRAEFVQLRVEVLNGRH